MIISGKKDDVFLEFKALDSLQKRIKQNKFVIEDALLIGRAIKDGLPVEKIIYTDKFLEHVDSDNVTGKDILLAAKSIKIECYKINEGLLGAITATRPLPLALASVVQPFYGSPCGLPSHCRLDPQSPPAILLTDSVSNPDNLGMILRTADAAGINAVAVLGNVGAGVSVHPQNNNTVASIFHKNCIRAARGAMGRLPILTGETDETIIENLKQNNFTIIGAAGGANVSLYSLPAETFTKPVAFIVGNESRGIRKHILEMCDITVSIPMLPNRDSLSVGVATGVLIYEWVRHNANLTAKNK